MLVQWLLETELAGYAFSHGQIREMASIINKSSGGDGHIGKTWARYFIKRNPKIKTKTGISIASQRVHHLYQSDFKQWFSRLQCIILIKGVLDANV